MRLTFPVLIILTLISLSASLQLDGKTMLLRSLDNLLELSNEADTIFMRSQLQNLRLSIDESQKLNIMKYVSMIPMAEKVDTLISVIDDIKKVASEDVSGTGNDIIFLRRRLNRYKDLINSKSPRMLVNPQRILQLILVSLKLNPDKNCFWGESGNFWGRAIFCTKRKDTRHVESTIADNCEEYENCDFEITKETKMKRCSKVSVENFGFYFNKDLSRIDDCKRILTYKGTIGLQSKEKKCSVGVSIDLEFTCRKEKGFWWWSDDKCICPAVESSNCGCYDPKIMDPIDFCQSMVQTKIDFQQYKLYRIGADCN